MKKPAPASAQPRRRRLVAIALVFGAAVTLAVAGGFWLREVRISRVRAALPPLPTAAPNPTLRDLLADAQAQAATGRLDAVAELGRLDPDALMPLGLYAVGTLLLLLIAFIFSRYTAHIARHYTVYRLQLVSMTPTFSGIAESIDAHRPILQHVYYAVPIFDLAIWLAYYAAGLAGGVSRLVW